MNILLIDSCLKITGIALMINNKVVDSIQKDLGRLQSSELPEITKNILNDNKMIRLIIAATWCIASSLDYFIQLLRNNLIGSRVFSYGDSIVILFNLPSFRDTDYKDYLEEKFKPFFNVSFVTFSLILPKHLSKNDFASSPLPFLAPSANAPAAAAA